MTSPSGPGWLARSILISNFLRRVVTPWASCDSVLARPGPVSVRANLHGRPSLACGMESRLAGGGLDAVCGVRLVGDFGTAREHDPGLPPVPMPHLRQAVQRAQRGRAEPNPVSL